MIYHCFWVLCQCYRPGSWIMPSGFPLRHYPTTRSITSDIRPQNSDKSLQYLLNQFIHVPQGLRQFYNIVMCWAVSSTVVTSVTCNEGCSYKMTTGDQIPAEWQSLIYLSTICKVQMMAKPMVGLLTWANAPYHSLYIEMSWQHWVEWPALYLSSPVELSSWESSWVLPSSVDVCLVFLTPPSEFCWCLCGLAKPSRWVLLMSSWSS